MKIGSENGGKRVKVKYGGPSRELLILDDLSPYIRIKIFVETKFYVGKDDGEHHGNGNYPKPSFWKRSHLRDYEKCYDIKKQKAYCWNSKMIKCKTFPIGYSAVDKSWNIGDKVQQ